MTESLLQEVATSLPKDSWKWVYRSLMENQPLAGNLLQDIESNHHNDLREQKFKALLKWRNCMGDKATVAALDAALRHNRCSHVADRYTESILKSSKASTGRLI